MRSTPLKTRSLVAMLGSYGYELDVRKMDPTEKRQIQEFITVQKVVAPIVQHGVFYRLWSPFDNGGAFAAWMSVTEDQTKGPFVRTASFYLPSPPRSHSP